MKLPLQILIVLIFGYTSNAQIKILVDKHPDFLIEKGELYMASSFNNWSPGNPNYLLKKGNDGTYSITLPDTLTYFEYKFTQGNWMLVEGGKDGRSRQNRIYDASQEANPKLIKVSIESWELKPSYVIIVKKVPKNTPNDASIYITGNFNNWNNGDERYQLKKQLDGTFRTIIYSDLPRLEYKFTRGTWESVEGRESGKARTNRVFNRAENTDLKNIEVEIESWEDLSGVFNFFSIFDLLMLFSSFQGLLLIIAIPTIQDYNRAANRWLVTLIAVASLMVLLHELSNHREFAQLYPKLLLLPNFLLFLYAPLFYFYLNKLLFQTKKLPKKWHLHFLLPLIQLCIYLPYFFMDFEFFRLKLVNEDTDLQIILSFMGLVGLISNFYYWNICRKMIQTYKRDYSHIYSYEQNIQYLNTVLFIQALCLILWIFTGLWVIFSYLGYFDNMNIVERSIDGIWLVFSTIVYFLGYFAIHQPEIFKLPQREIVFFDSPQKTINNETEDIILAKIEPIDENIIQLKSKIEAYMDKYKPYENPKLTLNDLAQKLKIQPHILSKVINDGFDKNFFDLINSYRVEEFKRRMEDPRYKNFTLLSIAFEVGFNSKTAFNRSFKKITNQTPSDFFE
jgi:AraC-like DNA-binding protein